MVQYGLQCPLVGIYKRVDDRIMMMMMGESKTTKEIKRAKNILSKSRPPALSR